MTRGPLGTNIFFDFMEFSGSVGDSNYTIMGTENEDVLDTYFTFVAQADGKFAESLKKAKRTLRDVEGMSHDVSYFT